MKCPWTTHTGRPRSGFTVIEMMIVVAILAVLVSIVIVSMSRVRLSAHRAETVNSLRQMVGGYSAYMNDHRQRLMPGYIDPDTVRELRINAQRLDDQRFIADFDDENEPYEDLSSYVWRLAPYLDFNWLVMFSDYPSGHTLSRLEEDLIAANGAEPEFGPASYNGKIEPDQRAASMIPAIGLNSIFLGGDTRHGGSYASSRHPWHEDVANGTVEKLAATRYTEVRNPSQIVVFAPTGRADANLDSEKPYIEPTWTDHPIGYAELRAPFLQRNDNGVWIADRRQWRVGQYMEIERRESGAYDEGAGLPIMRWGGNVLPVAHLDGSAMMEDIELLSTDMRRWAPNETGTTPPQVELN